MGRRRHRNLGALAPLHTPATYHRHARL